MMPIEGGLPFGLHDPFLLCASDSLVALWHMQLCKQLQTQPKWKDALQNICHVFSLLVLTVPCDISPQPSPFPPTPWFCSKVHNGQLDWCDTMTWLPYSSWTLLEWWSTSSLQSCDPAYIEILQCQLLLLATGFKPGDVLDISVNVCIVAPFWNHTYTLQEFHTSFDLYVYNKFCFSFIGYVAAGEKLAF